MKLAFLAPEFLPTWGGVGTYSIELIKNLCKDPEMDVYVITPRRGKDYDIKKVLDYFNGNIEILNLSNANDTFFYNFKFQLALLNKFRKIHKNTKFDITHAANLTHMPDAYFSMKKIGVPNITTIHTTIDSQSKLNGRYKLKKSISEKSAVEALSSISYFYIKFFQNLYLKRNSNYIAVSKWIKSLVYSNRKNENMNIEVISNGIDINRFSSSNKAGGGKFDFLDNIDKPKILYVGRLLSMKGLDVLIDALSRIKFKFGVKMHVVFAGIGNSKGWEKLLKEKGISKSEYSFLGYVDYENIDSLYNKCDIFVLPSFSESFPISILEAMGCEKPVIASKVGGVPEIIKNGHNGLLFEPGNSTELAEKILFVLNNKLGARKLTLNARTSVEKKFNSAIMAKKTKKFYEGVLNEGN